MGVHDFNKYLESKGYKTRTVSMGDLRDKNVAVDVSVFIHKAMSIHNEGKDIIRFFTLMIERFKLYNITPIFIFDGIPCKLKENEHKKRNKVREENESKLKKLETEINEIKKANSIETDTTIYELYMNNTISDDVKSKYSNLCSEYDKINKRIININKEDIKALKEYISKSNCKQYTIDYHEAESFCTYLSRKGKVDYVLSVDSDCIVFGSENVIIDYGNTKNEFECWNRRDVLKTLGFTDEDKIVEFKRMFHFGLLLGNDYIKRAKGNGPVTVHKMILESKNYGELEAKLYHKDIYSEFINEYLFDYSSML